MASDIINLARFTLPYNQVDRGAMVLHMEPVADIFAFTVDRQGLVVQRVRDQQRYEFLRELIRAVIVRAVGDGNRQAVSVKV